MLVLRHATRFFKFFLPKKKVFNFFWNLYWRFFFFGSFLWPTFWFSTQALPLTQPFTNQLIYTLGKICILFISLNRMKIWLICRAFGLNVDLKKGKKVKANLICCSPAFQGITTLLSNLLYPDLKTSGSPKVVRLFGMTFKSFGLQSGSILFLGRSKQSFEWFFFTKNMGRATHSMPLPISPNKECILLPWGYWKGVLLDVHLKLVC